MRLAYPRDYLAGRRPSRGHPQPQPDKNRHAARPVQEHRGPSQVNGGAAARQTRPLNGGRSAVVAGSNGGHGGPPSKSIHRTSVSNVVVWHRREVEPHGIPVSTGPEFISGRAQLKAEGERHSPPFGQSGGDALLPPGQAHR
jgi:hypothetical protein